MQEEEPFSDLIVGDVRKEWDWVKPEIEKLLINTPQNKYRPEDVYAACISKEAYLLISKSGFAVVTFRNDEYTDEKILFIWILCLTKVHTKKALLCGWARMSQFAKEAGCEIMETGTPLEKVGSHLLNTGWDLNTVEYSKRVK
jgi:hypothetical protein